MNSDILPSSRPMDLIIKPTEACNFSCTFCSSSYLVDDKKQRLHLDQVFDFLRRYPKTQTIIVNGGDPLMMPTQYYWEMIEFLDENDLPANISMTTNLWKFWQEWQSEGKEKKWTKLFRNERVNVTTSFQYGSGRRISPDRIFEEEDFIKITQLMLEKVGYKPSFIAVVEESNLDKAIDNVRLAKSLGVDCKLNYANMSGDCSSALPLSKVYKIYLQIWNEGLADHEWNTRQMANRLKGISHTTCPLNRTCDSGIRVLQPDGKYYSCGAFGDDKEYEIDFKAEIKGSEFFTPLADDFSIHALKSECYTCEMFQICNGCKKHIKDLKTRNQVEGHCSLMKEMACDILAINNLDHKTPVMNSSYFKGAGFLIEDSVKEEI